MRFNLNEGLILKKLETGDSKELFELMDKNRAHLRQWLPWVDSTKTQKDTLAFIESTIKQFSENKSIQCGIWLDEKLVGTIGQHRVVWANKWCSLGYWLGAEFEGRGLMTKSCKTMVDYSFREQNLNCVEIAAAVENKKSQAIPERLGFKREGVLRQRECLYGRFVDHAVYSLLKSEWSV